MSICNKKNESFKICLIIVHKQNEFKILIFLNIAHSSDLTCLLEWKMLMDPMMVLAIILITCQVVQEFSQFFNVLRVKPCCKNAAL